MKEDKQTEAKQVEEYCQQQQVRRVDFQSFGSNRAVTDIYLGQKSFYLPWTRTGRDLVLSSTQLYQDSQSNTATKEKNYQE